MDLISREDAIKAVLKWLREEDPFIDETSLINAIMEVATQTAKD